MFEGLFLNLNKDRLYGRESPKSSIVLGAMCEAVNLGHELPLVQVRVSRDGKYSLLDGHHRALAHYIMGRPLEVELIGSGELLENSIFIGDISLNEGLQGYGGHLMDYLSYLPRDIAERYCNDNGLSVCRYLSQQSL